MNLDRTKKDLQRNAHDRLRTWIEDTIWRFEALDLDSSEAIACAASILMDAVTEIAVRIDMDENEFLSILRYGFRYEVEHQRRLKKKSTQVK